MEAQKEGSNKLIIHSVKLKYLFESFMTGTMFRLTVTQLIVEVDNTIITPLLRQDMNFRGRHYGCLPDQGNIQ
jgi:hypothetical protein